MPRTMERPAKPLIEQRRFYARVGMEGLIKGATVLAGRDFLPRLYELVDLSGGGCKLSSEQPFIMNACLHLVLPVGESRLEVLGKVVHASPFPQDGRYFAGVIFTRIAEEQRELVIRFVFDKMRENLRAKRA